ncbi:mRNA surveillance protein pelota [[Eubacterium] cellulosolvens]
MKILNKDLKHGAIKVEINDLNDLWNLYNIIEKDDILFSKTMREVKHDEPARPSSRRVVINIGLKVLKTSFDRQLNRLRVHGHIIQAPEKYAIQGSHHTISLGQDSIIAISKERWFKHQLDRLKKGVKEERPLAVLCLDADEACLAFIQSFGVDVKGEIRSRLPGKTDTKAREEALNRYFSELIKILETFLKISDIKIIILGPGFLKDTFTKHLTQKDKNLATRIIAVKPASHGGVAGVYEALRSGLIGAIFKKSRLAEEIAMVEDVLKKIALSSGDISYGIHTVEEDAEVGSVQTLLISVDLLKKNSLKERDRIEKIIRTVEQSNGEITVISSEHEGGIKLASLGGVAAILRYPRHAWDTR